MQLGHDQGSSTTSRGVFFQQRVACEEWEASKPAQHKLLSEPHTTPAAASCMAPLPTALTLRVKGGRQLADSYASRSAKGCAMVTVVVGTWWVVTSGVRSRVTSGARWVSRHHHAVRWPAPTRHRLQPHTAPTRERWPLQNRCGRALVRTLLIIPAHLRAAGVCVVALQPPAAQQPAGAVLLLTVEVA